MNPILLAEILNPYVSAFDFTEYFTRIGHLLKTINLINTFRGTTMTTRANLIAADYTSSDQDQIDSLYTNLLNYQNANSGFPAQLKSMAQSMTISMVNDITPQVNLSYQTALGYIIQQMIDAGQTVSRCTVSSSYAATPTNYGNAVPVISTLTRMGVPTENAFAETITGTVISDSYSNGATAGQEVIRLQGQYAISDPLNWAYPVGSACNAVVVAVNGASNSQGGNANWLNNGSFEGTWTSNTPAQWTVDVGTPGTTILQATSIVYDGSNSLEFVGNGSELTSVYQTLNSSSGTTVAPSTLTQLVANLWIAVTGAPASGVLELALTDGSGTVILDAAGNPCKFTKSLVGVGASFVPVNGSFRTPALLPSVVRLRVRLSTALSVGGSVYLDRIAMTQPTQLYQQGPSVAVFSGNEKLVDGDGYSLTISNAYNGQIQRGMEILFGMRSLGYLLPSTAGTPTIPDSLIA